MKKIFVLTGEPSGDKLASKVINQLKNLESNIEYSSVGGEYLGALGIKSLYNLNEITYLGFTKVLLNIFKIKKKIKKTTNEIIKFKPDILFSVDSPDFTLRVAKEVKKTNPDIKIIHLVAPQVWIWREYRVKKLKYVLDHILLLFPFEKKYFDKENISSTFIGHPLLENSIKSKIDLSQIIKDDKKIFSIFPGSRLSEINTLMPILFKFIKLMNTKYKNLFFVFHSTKEHLKKIQNLIIREDLKNCETISDEKIKDQILKSSIFAVAKSGTISLEICNAKVPSIIIYKMNPINFFIIKMLVKVKFANIINITADKEIIPELIQSKCNSMNIFNTVDKLLSNREILENQITVFSEILNYIKSDFSPSKKAAIILNKELNN